MTGCLWKTIYCVWVRPNTWISRFIRRKHVDYNTCVTLHLTKPYLKAEYVLIDAAGGGSTVAEERASKPNQQHYQISISARVGRLGRGKVR